MKKHLIKIVSATLIAALLISGSTSAIASETLSGILPVAGNARVLGEGVSVTALKAEKIKNSRAGGQAVADVLQKDPGYFSWMLAGDFTNDTKQVLTRIRLKEYNAKK